MHHNVEEILDVYFVDDGCYMVATIVSIFSRYHLSVNMATGKTEVMLALRARMQRRSERSCKALMACGWILTMMRDRCTARCMSSLSTNTWEHG